MTMSPKWHMAYLVPIDGHFGQIGRCMDFKFVLPCSYITFDIQTNFEVDQIQIGHAIPKNTPKNHYNGQSISQNPILPKCHSPKYLLLLLNFIAVLYYILELCTKN